MHKFRAKPQKVDGHHFSSKLEAEYYGKLKLLQRSGLIQYFLRQVGFDLPGGIRYFCDFMIVRKEGIEFVDTKGYMTQLSRLKIKQVEDIYGVVINIIKKA